MLALGIGAGLPLGVRHTQRLQSGAGAAEARFAGDLSLVHCGGKAVRLSHALERFAPGTLMRGREQDAVDVENSRGQCAAVGPGAHGFADDHHGCTLLPIPAKCQSIKFVDVNGIIPRISSGPAAIGAAHEGRTYDRT